MCMCTSLSHNRHIHLQHGVVMFGACVAVGARLCRYQSSPYGSTTRSVNGHTPRIALPVREAVEQQVVRIMKALLLGSPGEVPDALLAPCWICHCGEVGFSPCKCW